MKHRKIPILMAVTTPFEPDPRVYKEARTLTEAGHRVTVCAWDRELRYRAAEQIDGVEVLRYRQRSQLGGRFRQLPGFLGFYRFVWRTLCERNYQLLHCHDLDTMPLGIAASMRGMPVIFDAHEPEYYAAYPAPWPALFRGLERLSARFAQWVLVTNDLQLKKYRRWGFSRVSLIRNVPPARFAREARLRQRTAAPLTVGRIGFIKKGVGVEELFEALARLRSDGYDVRGLLVGKVHPDIRPELQALLAGAPYVQYVGDVRYNDVPSWYAHVDVAVAMYTRTEEHRLITPTKVLESLVAGVPVIASPVGDVVELQARYGGIVVLQDGTSRALADAIRQFASDPGKLASFRKATERARRELVWEQMEGKLLMAYDQVLGRIH